MYYICLHLHYSTLKAFGERMLYLLNHGLALVNADMANICMYSADSTTLGFLFIS